MIHHPNSLPDASRTAASVQTEAIYLIDRRGRILFTSPVGASFYGFKPNDLIGQSVMSFLAPQYESYVRSEWRKLINNPEQASAELAIEIIDVNHIARPIRASVWRIPGHDLFITVHHILDNLRDRLETLYSVLSALTGTLDLDAVLQIVMQEASRLITADNTTIFITDEHGQLRMKGSRGKPVSAYSNQIIRNAAEFETIKHLFSTKSPHIINDCHADPMWTAGEGSESIQSWIGVPLIHHDEIVGILNLDCNRPNAFTQEDVALAQALATQVAAAIHNARRYEAEQKRAERYAALNDISLAISHLDLNSVLEVIYRKIRALMDVSSFYVALYDAEMNTVSLTGAYEHNTKIDDTMQDADSGLIGRVLKQRESLILHDIQSTEMPSEAIIDGEVPLSLAMFPLFVQETMVGLYSVQSYQSYAFSSDDIAILEAIAATLATAIKNAQLYDETAEQLSAISTLHRMSLELAAVQDPLNVAQLSIRAVMQLFTPDQIELFVENEPPDHATLWVGAQEDGKFTLQSYFNPQTDVLREEILHNDQPVVLNDLLTQPEQLFASFAEWPVLALASYPLTRAGRSFGRLTLLYKEPHLFRRNALRALDLLSMQAATALENARYNAALRRRLHEATTLQDMARRVSNSLSLDDMLDMVVHTLRDTFQCLAAVIGLVDTETGIISRTYGAGIEPDKLNLNKTAPPSQKTIARHVVKIGDAVYIPNANDAPDFTFLDPRTASVLAIPLTVHDRVIGSLGLNSDTPNAFTPDHERVLVIAGGQIAAAIETMRLLDESRSHAAELAEANNELAALDDLRNELVQNLSHELRNPLSLITGYAGLMSDQQLGPVNAAQIDALEIIMHKAEAITRMIGDILSLEQIRADTLDRQWVDINQLCQTSLAGIQLVHHDRQLNFVLETTPGQFTVHGDLDRLNQVLDNLLGNAVKFTPDDRTITVRTRLDPDRPGFILIDVHDEGIGIPPEKIAHIFERFYQGDRAIRQQYGGTGLGLSIASRIIKAHAGEIWAESVEQQGSTFTCALPLVAPPESPIEDSFRA